MESNNTLNAQAPVESDNAQNNAADIGPASLLDDEPKKTDGNKLNVIFKTIVLWSGLAVQIALIVLMVFGVSSAFGTKTDIMGLIDFTVALFSIHSGKIFKTLTKAAIAVIYICMMVVLVKSLINQVKTVSLFKNTKREDPKKITVGMVYENGCKAIMTVLIYMSVCYLLSGDALPVLGYLAIALITLFYVMTSVFESILGNLGKLKDKKNLGRFIFQIIRPVLLAVLLPLLANYLYRPSGYGIIDSLTIIFTGHIGSGFSGFIATVYEYWAKNIINIVEIGLFLTAISWMLYDVNTTGKRGAFDRLLGKKFIVILILEAVLVGLFIIYAMAVSVDSTVASAIFGVLRVEHIPAMLISLAIVLTVNVLGEPVSEQRQSTNKVVAAA